MPVRVPPPATTTGIQKSTMVVALVVLQERPGTTAVVGGLMVIAGIVVVASGTAGASRRRARAGLVWGAATGAAIAAYTLFDDHAVTTWALLPVPYFALSTAWQAILMTPALRRRTTLPLLTVLRRNRWEIGIVAVLSPLAYILVLEAMRTTPVSLVAPARETSIVVGALLAWWVFHEPRPLRRFLGAAVVLTGIALIVA